jgi:flagellar hook-length control protein FliK
MLPVNLLALDSASFDTSLKAGQGIQPPETGFSVAFGNLMQAPETNAGTLVTSVTFPLGSDALKAWPVPGGEGLPQTGNALPPPGAAGLPGIETGAGEITENLSAVEVLAPAPADLAGASAPVPPTIHSIPVFPEGTPAAPTGNDLATAAAAAPVVPLQSGAAPGARANAAHSGVLQHIRNLKPAPDAPTRPVMDTGAPVALQRSEVPPMPQPVSTTPQVMAGVQEYAQQVTTAARTSNALMPAGAEASLPGETQDLKAVQPSVAPLPSIATIKAPPPANTAPSPAAPMQWSGSSIDVAPGQAGWNEALGDRVTWMAGNKIQNAELRLNPAELGPLRVQISMDDGNATVTFTAQHPFTRDAIEQALPRLREMLADQGLSLQNASVNDHGPRHQQAGAGGRDAAPQFVSAHATNGNGMADGENLSPLMRAPSGLVDVFA